VRISRGQERAKPYLVIANLKSVCFNEIVRKGDILQELRDRIGDKVTFSRNRTILANYIEIMRFSTTASLLALSSLLGAAAAHNIQLKAHDRECFHENLHKDDKMTVTFQVGDREFGGAGNLDIDFWVSHHTA
jgi:hypothetical protein